jgi:hypothetical protein
MADKKISALTGASTPLAGTEVLPIVQSGSTVKVAVSDLTVGRAVSMASVTASNLTSGRVATVGTSGLIQDDADLQFNGQDLGVGTAPKTWAAADFYGLQVGKGIAIFGRGSGDQDRGGFTSNAYNDGSWKRIATGNAAQYYQNDGNHTFYTAVSGAADSAISWVEVAEIDEANKNFKVSAGNVVIGTSGKGIAYPVTSGGSALAPAFSAYRSGANQALVTATITKVQLNTEEFDTNSNFDSTTNYRFTPTVAGYYQISGSVGLTGTNTRIFCAIYKNGSEYLRGIDAAVNLSQVNVSGLVYFNGSTDYIELYAFGTFVGTSDISSGQKYTFLTGVLVRGA